MPTSAAGSSDIHTAQTASNGGDSAFLRNPAGCDRHLPVLTLARLRAVTPEPRRQQRIIFSARGSRDKHGGGKTVAYWPWYGGSIVAT